MNYQRNKLAAQTRTTTETATDQAAAHDTDRNVIIGRYLIHGQTPSSRKPPMYANFAGLPTDLAGFISQARHLAHLRRKLPEQLKNHSMEQLMTMDANELTRILTPAEIPPPKPEEQK